MIRRESSYSSGDLERGEGEAGDGGERSNAIKGLERLCQRQRSSPRSESAPLRKWRPLGARHGDIGLCLLVSRDKDGDRVALHAYARVKSSAPARQKATHTCHFKERSKPVQGVDGVPRWTSRTTSRRQDVDKLGRSRTAPCRTPPPPPPPPRLAAPPEGPEGVGRRLAGWVRRRGPSVPQGSRGVLSAASRCSRRSRPAVCAPPLALLAASLLAGPTC